MSHRAELLELLEPLQLSNYSPRVADQVVEKLLSLGAGAGEDAATIASRMTIGELSVLLFVTNAEANGQQRLWRPNIPPTWDLQLEPLA